MLTARTEFRELEKVIRRMDNALVRRAAPPAINRVVSKVNSVATKEVSAVSGIKKKDVRTKLQVKKARARDLTAYVDAAEGKAVTIRRFVTPARRREGQAGQPQFFRRRDRKGAYKYQGIEANPWRRKRVFPGTFIAKGRSGNVLPFVRTGPGRRSKLKVIRGPSIRLEFNRRPVQTKLRATVRQRFPIEFRRTLDLQIRRLAKR